MPSISLASVGLGIFLSIALMSLNLIELAGTALPMLIILSVQVVVMALFGWFITFRVMGSDFDAAVMAGMKALVEPFGPAPRVFLVVPIAGAFLIDLVNAINITGFINWMK